MSILFLVKKVSSKGDNYNNKGNVMDILDSLSQWGKEKIPSNIRLFGSTMFGDRSPINENYFTK